MQENAIEWLSTQKVVTVTLGNGRIKTLHFSFCHLSKCKPAQEENR